jgi:[Skp1-protein]-hydroxyproline N-acetylglucosaminyltransferase
VRIYSFFLFFFFSLLSPDFQCRETITSALERAAFPGRVVVGAIQQNAEGDIGCIEPHKPCEEDPNQVLCSRKDQIRLFKIDSTSATGPVFARHVGDRLYRGESFAMQLDAHVQFIKDWDLLMISQFHETKNEMAVLSTYLTDVQKSISKEGLSLRRTRPIMCNRLF